MGNAYELERLKNNIYKVAKAYCSKLFIDDLGWAPVYDLANLIRNISGINDVCLGAGKYYNYFNYNEDAYREYKLEIDTDYGALCGFIRCYSRGGVEHLFSRFVMGLQLWRDEAKDVKEHKSITITRSQLSEVEDTMKTELTFTGNTAEELGTNAQNAVNDATKSGMNARATTLNGRTSTNNADDRNEVAIAPDSSKSNVKDAVKSAFDKAVSNGADRNKIVVKGNTEDILNGVQESVSYTKGQLMEAKQQAMEKNCTMYTKRDFLGSCYPKN